MCHGVTLGQLNRSREARMVLCDAWSRRDSFPDNGAAVAQALEELGADPADCDQQPE